MQTRAFIHNKRICLPPITPQHSAGEKSLIKSYLGRIDSAVARRQIMTPKLNTFSNCTRKSKDRSISMQFSMKSKAFTKCKCCVV